MLNMTHEVAPQTKLHQTQTKHLTKISKRTQGKLIVSSDVTKWVKSNANKTICQTKNYPWNLGGGKFQPEVTILHADIPIIPN